MPEYLIIGGATRCGTTSLYLYLAAHPAICRSTVKETRFFLEEEYPLERKIGFREGVNKYDEYFSHCEPGAIRLEATPDYLYSAHAPGRIHRTLETAKVVFLLRNPIDRFISWYKYGRQRGLLPSEVPLNAFAEASLEDSFPFDASYQMRMALKHGRYSEFLQSYLAIFDPEEVMVYSYDDLKSRPSSIVLDICAALNISPDSYAGYSYRVHNPSVTRRWPVIWQCYDRVLNAAREIVRDQVRLRKSLGAVRQWYEDKFKKLDRSESGRGQFSLSPQNYQRINDYYRDEAENLARCLGLSDWAWTGTIDVDEGI